MTRDWQKSYISENKQEVEHSVEVGRDGRMIKDLKKIKITTLKMAEINVEWTKTLKVEVVIPQDDHGEIYLLHLYWFFKSNLQINTNL